MEKIYFDIIIFRYPTIGFNDDNKHLVERKKVGKVPTRTHAAIRDVRREF